MSDWDDYTTGTDPQEENQQQTTGTDESLDWNMDLTEEDATPPETKVLPKGRYAYMITHYKRGFHEASAKLPKCPQAIVSFRISHDGENVEVNKFFFVHPKMKWQIAQLWTSCGLRKKGETVKADWNQLSGSTGMCDIDIRTYKKKDGTESQSNDLTLLPPDTPQTTSTDDKDGLPF